jgi:hypothetical protein
MQGGSIVDQSSYAHTLSVVAGGVTTDVVNAAFPGGKGVQITASHASGIEILGAGSEFNQGNGGRTYEFFIYLASGALSLINSQIVFNDGFGFAGNLAFINRNTGSTPGTDKKPGMRINSGGGLTTSGVPVLTELEAWYVVMQTDASAVNTVLHMWAGKVSDGVATGDSFDHTASITRPIASVTAGPYIGYVGASGGSNDFVLGPYRITKNQRYSGSSVPIPTAIFPTS